MTQWAIEDGNISEANGTATNILSGLAKAWSNYSQVTPAINDSFNVSSVTDFAAGSHSIYYTNDMANTNYSVGGLAAGNNYGAVGTSTATSYVDRRTWAYGGTTLTDCVSYCSIHGDLA